MKYLKITDNPYIGYVSRKDYNRLKSDWWFNLKWKMNPFSPMKIKVFRRTK
jgi:hypothetical protein